MPILSNTSAARRGRGSNGQGEKLTIAARFPAKFPPSKRRVASGFGEKRSDLAGFTDSSGPVPSSNMSATYFIQFFRVNPCSVTDGYADVLLEV
jgi:hypothetical protein